MASLGTLVERFAVASRAVHHHRLRRRPTVEVLEGRALLATFTVNSLGDVGSGSGDSGDLRYCINQANADDQANTIVFDPTMFGTPQTITLKGGQLELEDNGGTQTITGPGAGVTISGGGNSRVFQVDGGVTASISGLTISGGSAGGAGGGLVNNGTTTITDCTISGNTVTRTVTYGYYGQQYSSDQGGGVFNSGTATLTDCTISGNTAFTEIERSGQDYNTNYYFYGDGGGVFNSGTVTLTDCTVSGNDAGSAGGGVDNSATANLTDCTISGNDGDGMYNGGTATLTDTIGAGNTGGDFGGPSNVSGSYNLIGTGGSGGLTNGVNGNIVLTSLTGLGLAPLGNYGGPTQTMALLPGSPAIGAGVIADYPGTTTPVTTDQRGEPLDTPNPDIGAVQTQDPTLIPLAFSGISNQSITYGTSSVTISGTLAVGSQAPVGETVAVTLDSIQQSAAIGTGGAFSTTFDTTALTVAGVPYAITYAYTSDGTFASASATTELTINPATPTIFTVNSLGDAGSGSGAAGDLRYCINQANSDDQANQIVFDSTVFSTPQTITLSGTQFWLEDTGGTQTITGPAAGVTISGGGTKRVFQVDGGVTASISGLTISGGSEQNYGGGLGNYGTVTLTDCTISGNAGGGVSNTGNLTLTDCTLSANSAFNGSGVWNTGTANLADCTFSGNTSSSRGGGVFNSGTANLNACTVSDNTASSTGGGVFNSGNANLTLTACTVSGNNGGGLGNYGGTSTLIDCTVSGNTAAYGGGACNYGRASYLTLTGCIVSGNISDGSGGGVFNGSTVNLTDCTLSDNTAGTSGGGVYNPGTATLTACTLSGNSASQAAGLSNPTGYGYTAKAALTDTIVAGNTGGDIGGRDVSGSYNLIGTGGSGGLANGVDGNIVLTTLAGLGLAPLGNYGGPTQTIALLPGSPSIGAGVIADYPGTSTPITTDQRGEPLDSPNPDIGAFQTQRSTLIALSFSVISDQSITYGTSSATVSGTLANGSQAPVGETVDVTLDGDEQPATIGSGGAFSTTFDTTGLTVSDSPDTIIYAYTTDGTFASASTISTLTVNPATLTIAANPETKIYGTADPALAYTASGLQLSDTAASVLTGALARRRGAPWAASKQAATRSAGGRSPPAAITRSNSRATR